MMLVRSSVEDGNCSSVVNFHNWAGYDSMHSFFRENYSISVGSLRSQVSEVATHRALELFGPPGPILISDIFLEPSLFCRAVAICVDPQPREK